MTNKMHIPMRAARDLLIDSLNIGKTYPLQDLPVGQVIVPYGSVGKIPIQQSQVDVEYELHDMDNQPMPRPVDAEHRSFRQKGNGQTVFLATPPILGNVSFQIRALKTNEERTAYLHQLANAIVGLDTSLNAFIRSQRGADPHIIDYETSVVVEIENSQDGVDYALVAMQADKEPSEVELSSNEAQGNLTNIELSSIPMLEDTVVRVRATKNFPVSEKRKSETALLDVVFALRVRPNPSLQIESFPGNIINYGESATIKLVGAQPSTDYELYQRVLIRSDYVPQDTLDDTLDWLVIQTEEGNSVWIKAPEKITDWNDPSGFESVGMFAEEDGKPSVAAAELREDTVLIVKATKKENKQSVQLDSAVVILVRPDTEPTLGEEQRQHGDWNFQAVTVTGTQKGVAYQLRLDKDDQPVNPPGYHYEDRGVETTRLEVDFVIEAEDESLLLLPTGELTRKTTFNVLATKTLSGISAPLKSTIDVSPPAG